MKLLYFAWIQEELGIYEETLDCQTSMNLADLLQKLVNKGGKYQDIFERREKYYIALNQRLSQTADKDLIINNSDTIAFFPPVSGG